MNLEYIWCTIFTWATKDSIGVKDVITWVVILLGWYTVHHFSAKRDREKEARDYLRKIVSFTEELAQDAIAYHTAKSRDEEREEVILRKIQRLSFMLQLAKKMTSRRDFPLVRNLRKSITLTNFQTNKFKQQEPRGEIILSIIREEEELIKTLF